MLLSVIRDIMLMILTYFSRTKNVTEIENKLLIDFSCSYDWFVDNELSTHFGQDKTKSILFGTKTNSEMLRP